jgi:hypothetical protein
MGKGKISARSAEGFVVKGGLGSGRIGSEQGMHELPWVDSLPSGGFQQTGKDTVGDQSAFRSREGSRLEISVFELLIILMIVVG